MTYYNNQVKEMAKILTNNFDKEQLKMIKNMVNWERSFNMEAISLAMKEEDEPTEQELEDTKEIELQRIIRENSNS